MTPFATASSKVESDIAALQSQVAALQSTPFIPGPPSPSRAYQMDIRDFGARCDGKTDDAWAIQKAQDAAPLNASTPAPGGMPLTTVYLPPLRTLVSQTILMRTPAVQLRGEGLAGGDFRAYAMSAISTLVAAPGFQGSAVLSWDPLEVNAHWGLQGFDGLSEIRGVSCRNVCVDLVDAPTVTAFQLRSLSNCPEFSHLSCYGGTGMLLDVGTSQMPHAPYSLPCEGLRLVNCYSYGAMDRNGRPTGLSATGPMARLGGCNETRIVDGKLLWMGGASQGFPAWLIEPEIVARDNGQIGVYPGAAIMFCCNSTGGREAHYSVRGAEANGFHYRASNLTWFGAVMEGWNVGIEINQDPVSPGVDGLSFLSQNVDIGISNSFRTPQGVAPMAVVADYVWGGEMRFNNLGESPLAGVRTGKHTCDIRGHGGINPNALGAGAKWVDEGINQITFTPYHGFQP